jgi:hypothetical protein
MARLAENREYERTRGVMSCTGLRRSPPGAAMFRSLAPTLLTLLASPVGLQADGCKYALNGRFVPEREQRALIE